MLTELSFAPVDPDSKEQRRIKRWQLVNYLRVFDTGSRALLGHVVDLNEDGIMILSTEPLICGKQYQMRMERLSGGEFTQFELSAVAQWTKLDKDPHFHNTGFRLLDPSPEALQSLQGLIDELRRDQDRQAAEEADSDPTLPDQN